MNESKKHRLVTRSDFDGLVCAVLLKDMDLIDEITFVHPKDMQDGKVEITDNDIITNLPYVPGCFLAFDHHHSEGLRTPLEDRKNHILDPAAPSAARVVYNYYGGFTRFTSIADDLMTAVDKGDSGDFSLEEILNPQRWDLLNFLMDARTGLGRWRHFRISNYNLMMDLIDYCKNHTIEEILDLPDVRERVEFFRSHDKPSTAQLRSASTIHENLIVLDLRDEEEIYVCNRFKIYALYPECNISIHVMWGRQKQNIVFAVGKSVINRSSNTNIGELMLKYDGGGHPNAGTCQVPTDKAEQILKELIAQINSDG